jgi:hypothetical protein
MREWKFADPEVDHLLNSPSLAILKKYPHTTFHVERYDAKGTLDMLNRPAILSWTRKLSEAIRRSLRNMITR